MKFEKIEKFRHEIEKNFFQPTFIVPRTSEVHWGLCVPSVCAPKEVEIALNELLTTVVEESGIKFEVEVRSNQCHAKHDDWLCRLDLTTIFVT